MIRRVISWHQVSVDLTKMANVPWRKYVLDHARKDVLTVVPGGTVESVEFIDRPSDAVLSKLGYSPEMEATGMEMLFTCAMVKEPDANVEEHVRNALVESAGAHLNKAMLTKCLSCGHLGTDHVDRMPPGCDGFKMENTDADGPE